MAEDKILIHDLLVRGILGVNDWERQEKQDIVINLALFTDVRPAARTDELENAVNYRTVCKKIVEHVEGSSRLTVEALAEDIARLTLSIPRVHRVRVRVEKPGAVRFSRSVGVEIERGKGDFD